MNNPEIYADDYYVRIAELEDRYWWHLGMRRIAEVLLRSCDPAGRYRSALDAGCGTGATMVWLRTRLGTAEAVGVDIASNALHLCSARGASRVAQASVLNLPFRDDAFDLAVCQDVLQHLPTDGGDLAALRELRRVLQPGGRLLVRANSRLGMLQGRAMKDPDFQRYLLRELAEACTRAGLQVERATYANALPALYGSLAQWCRAGRGRLRARRMDSPPPPRLYQGLSLPKPDRLPGWLNRSLLALMMTEARYLGRPHRCIPFGHTTFCVARK